MRRGSRVSREKEVNKGNQESRGLRVKGAREDFKDLLD
jgi:hypothetical protein